MLVPLFCISGTMTKTRSPHLVAMEGSRALVDNKESKKASNRRKINKLAVKAYRQCLKQDPLHGQQLKDPDKEWAKKCRRRQTTEELNKNAPKTAPMSLCVSSFKKINLLSFV